AQQHDGLALAHVAKLEFFAEEHRELGVVQRFVHGVPPPAKSCSVLILRGTHCERTARPDYRARVSKDGGSPDRGLMLRGGRRRRPPQHEAVESMRPNGRFHNSRYSAASFRVSRCPLGLALRRKSRHSSRSRALLRKICSLPARYCGGQWMPAGPDQARALHAKYGATGGG